MTASMTSANCTWTLTEYASMERIWALLKAPEIKNNDKMQLRRFMTVGKTDVADVFKVQYSSSEKTSLGEYGRLYQNRGQFPNKSSTTSPTGSTWILTLPTVNQQF